MNKNIRIGTRDSALAMWQAQKVKAAIEAEGISCSLVPVKSPGDKDLTTPLHLFGTTGIFTKILDDALFENQIDIAVHSLKDYPTQAPEGLAIAAVLKRGPHEDILVYNGTTTFLEDESKAMIATGSIRRIAQWKSRYPHHETTNLRGNVQTRLRKLKDNNWQGAIFAKAGLERMDLIPEHHIILDWMIPAPAQGVIGIGCRTTDEDIVDLLKKINHEETFLRAQIERQFLGQVEGGCSAPVGALTRLEDNNIFLTAGVFELDGSKKVIVERSASVNKASDLGKDAANEALKIGGSEIMQKIKNV